MQYSLETQYVTVSSALIFQGGVKMVIYEVTVSAPDGSVAIVYRGTSARTAYDRRESVSGAVLSVYELGELVHRS